MGNWRVRAGAWAVGLIAVSGVVAPGAGAAGEGGPIQIYAQGTDVTSPILVTGAITDYGKATSVDKSGKPDQNGDYEKVVLTKGGFWIDATELNKALAKVRPTVDQKHCFFSFKGTGPTKLFKGTGAYAGIGGTVNVELSLVAIAPKTASGKCNMTQNAQPVAQYGNVTGSGTVSFK
jgi:hypothetical protein